MDLDLGVYAYIKIIYLFQLYKFIFYFDKFDFKVVMPFLLP